MAQDALFIPPPRVAGEAEQLLDVTLAAWALTEHLVGDEHSSARGVLRDAARAVDAARDDLANGEGSAYSFARANELYRGALDAARPQRSEGGEDDELDALLGDMGATGAGLRNGA